MKVPMFLIISGLFCLTLAGSTQADCTAKDAEAATVEDLRTRVVHDGINMSKMLISTPRLSSSGGESHYVVSYTYKKTTTPEVAKKFNIPTLSYWMGETDVYTDRNLKTCNALGGGMEQVHDKFGDVTDVCGSASSNTSSGPAGGN